MANHISIKRQFDYAIKVAKHFKWCMSNARNERERLQLYKLSVKYQRLAVGLEVRLKGIKRKMKVMNA